MRILPCVRLRGGSRSGQRSRYRPQLETLESRTVPYSASGNVWPHPQLVTVSFIPDGANLGGPSSNLFSTFNSLFGSASAWQTPILRAVQTWAQQANLNFTVIGDNGTSSGGGNYEQGDSAIGDIRIGGFNFSNSGILALGYQPSAVNNYSIAGDIAFNTGQIFNVNGGDYDLYTVALHELGHALGLNHSSSASAVMYSSYLGAMSGLGSDDIAGIRNIYGPRSDTTSNSSFSTALDLTSQINAATLTAKLSNMQIASTSDVQYYKFTVPAGASSTSAIAVDTKGLSLLAASLRMYNSSGSQIAAATGSGYYGSNPTANVSLTPGQTYYLRIAGANTSAFGTGAFGLVLNFNGGTTPVVTGPSTQTPNGNPRNGGGGMANRTDSNGLSITMLLGETDRSTNRLLGGGLLGGLIDAVVSDIIELPFADVMTSDRPAADRPGLSDLPRVATLPFTAAVAFPTPALPQPSSAGTPGSVATTTFTQPTLYLRAAPITTSTIEVFAQPAEHRPAARTDAPAAAFASVPGRAADRHHPGPVSFRAHRWQIDVASPTSNRANPAANESQQAEGLAILLFAGGFLAESQRDRKHGKSR
jgi:hypothetical protein